MDNYTHGQLLPPVDQNETIVIRRRELDALRTENARLRECETTLATALKPFAEDYDEWQKARAERGDYWLESWILNEVDFELMANSLKLAADALKQAESEAGE